MQNMEELRKAISELGGSGEQSDFAEGYDAAIRDALREFPEDEPVFLLRARDKHAAETLRYYAKKVYASGGDWEIVEAVERLAEQMDEWPNHKAPDMT